jgi:hypothetical protein
MVGRTCVCAFHILCLNYEGIATWEPPNIASVPDMTL